MTAILVRENTPLLSIRRSMDMFPADQISQLIVSGRFSAAAQLLRGSRSGRVADVNLYDTFHAELSFETGDDSIRCVTGPRMP